MERKKEREKKEEKGAHLLFLFQAIQNAGKLLLIHVSTLILLFYGAYLVIQNTITYALLITFFLYSASSLTGAAGVMGLYASYTSVREDLPLSSFSLFGVFVRFCLIDIFFLPLLSVLTFR
jgi:hypothetical protein